MAGLMARASTVSTWEAEAGRLTRHEFLQKGYIYIYFSSLIFLHLITYSFFKFIYYYT
jgi:fluoride ion exporter CrcB/FEX